MKRVFLSFRSKMIQEEKLSENDVIENKRRNLEEFLLNDSRINSSHKYPELDEIYEHEDVWTDLPDSYRRKVVEKINPQLLNRELRQLKLMRDTNIEKIKILFKTIPGINYKITWAETQQLLLENEEFMSDKDLQNMDKEDALNIFQDHIIELERVHKEEIEFIEQSKRLYYAECREKFWELLQKLYDWRKIHKDSSWKQIYPLIKEENEFKNMLGIPGSSPLDIFKIFHFDMRTNYLHDTEVIEKVMKSHSIEIHSRTSFESFYSNLKHYSETSSTRRSNMLMYYDMMMSKLKKVKRKVDAFTPYEKKRVAFKKILYRLGNKVITKTTKYNEVIRRISDTPEFKDFNDENEKYRIFKKMRLYLNRDSKNTPNADYSNSSESTDSASSMNFSE
ncbi:MAG: PRP40 pre-mRNA processing factor 40 [Marteilia pararefringens]